MPSLSLAHSRPGLGLAPVLVAGGVAAAIVGCGGEGPGDWPAGRPRIDWLRYLQQEPAAPSELQFALEFVDGDGNVGEGGLDLFIQDRFVASLSSAALFAAQSPPVGSDATRGVLEFVVGLDPSLAPGARIRVGVELVDGQRQRSNRPFVELRVVGQEDGT